MNICPVCRKPTQPAELHAYGKCEDCYNPAPATTLASLGSRARDVAAARELVEPMPRTEFQHDCGGGHRVIKTTRGLS